MFLVVYVVKLPTRSGPSDKLDDDVRALMPHSRAAPGIMAAGAVRLVASHPPLHCKLLNQLRRAGAESDGV